MGSHQPRARFARFRASLKKLRVDEIDRADVQGGGDPNLAAKRDDALDKVEAHATEIKAAVDMRGLYVKESSARRPPPRTA